VRANSGARPAGQTALNAHAQRRTCASSPRRHRRHRAKPIGHSCRLTVSHGSQHAIMGRAAAPARKLTIIEPLPAEFLRAERAGSGQQWVSPAVAPGRPHVCAPGLMGAFGLVYVRSLIDVMRLVVCAQSSAGPSGRWPPAPSKCSSTRRRLAGGAGSSACRPGGRTRHESEPPAPRQLCSLSTRAPGASVVATRRALCPLFLFAAGRQELSRSAAVSFCRADPCPHDRPPPNPMGLTSPPTDRRGARRLAARDF
jgi:hypothetical protein